MRFEKRRDAESASGRIGRRSRLARRPGVEALEARIPLAGDAGVVDASFNDTTFAQVYGSETGDGTDTVAFFGTGSDLEHQLSFSKNPSFELSAGVVSLGSFRFDNFYDEVFTEVTSTRLNLTIQVDGRQPAWELSVPIDFIGFISSPFPDVVSIGHPHLATVSVVDADGATWSIRVIGLHSDFADPGEPIEVHVPDGESATFDLFAEATLTAPSPGLPDIHAVSARLDSALGATFEYEVEGHPGPFDVGFYRSADLTFDPDPAVDVPIGGTTVTPPAAGSGTVSFVLPSPPVADPGRPYVLAVADPWSALRPHGEIAESYEDNNLAVVQSDADVAAVSLEWNAWAPEHRFLDIDDPNWSDRLSADERAGGVKLTYRIDGVGLPSPARIEVFWARPGATGPEALGEPIDVGLTRTQPGESPSMIVPAAQLGSPPDGASELMVVFNRGFPVTESDRDNNVATLMADADAIMRDAVARGTGDHTKAVIATLLPAGGALTLEQAAKLCGVDHFNVLQFVTDSPPAWTIYRIDKSTWAMIAKDLGGQRIGDRFAGSQYLLVPTDSDRLDPPIDMEEFVYVAEERNDDGTYQHAVLKDFGTDDEIYYFNEDLTLPFTYLDRERSVPGDGAARILGFRDTPSVPSGFYRPNQSRGYRTQFVGVGADGSTVTLSGKDTKFTWRSNVHWVNFLVGELPFGSVVFANPDPSLDLGDTSGVVYAIASPDGSAPLAALERVAPLTMDEGSRLSITLRAGLSDPDVPAVFRLLDPTPDGMSLDPATGLLEWVAGQGPTTISCLVGLESADPRLGFADVMEIEISVRNVAPIVEGLADVGTAAGHPLALSGRFRDPGAGPWSATVDYGEGGEQPLGLNPDRTFTLNHTYATAGTRTVTVRVRDGLGGLGTATFRVTVAAPRADHAPPRVVRLVRIGHTPVTAALVVTFNEAVQVARVQDRRNYRIRAAGRDGRFGTRDDVLIGVASARLDAARRVVTLRPRAGLTLSSTYRLEITGVAPRGVVDLAGNLLDGNRDGRPGGNFARLFRGPGPGRL